MAGEYVKRRMFRLSHPDGAPVQCRVVVSPQTLNLMSAEGMAKYVVRKAMKFFDVDSPKNLTIHGSCDLEDDDDERGNC